MFAHFLELTVKPQKKPELIHRMRDEILPLLRKYDRFYDLIPLEVETEPTKVMLVSLWHEKFEAEKYEREAFPKVKQILEPFLTLPIVIKYCNVESTIPQKIKVAVAA